MVCLEMATEGARIIIDGRVGTGHLYRQVNGTELHKLNAGQQHHHQRAEREKGHKLLSGVHSLVDDLPPDIVAKRTAEDAIEKAFGFCNSRICGRAFVVWTSDNGNHKRIVYRAFFMAPSSSVHRRIFFATSTSASNQLPSYRE